MKTLTAREICIYLEEESPSNSSSFLDSSMGSERLRRFEPALRKRHLTTARIARYRVRPDRSQRPAPGPTAA